MPHTQQGIAFSGVTTQSRHASFQGAEIITPVVPSLQLRYLAFLKLRGEHGATDQEAAEYLGVKVTTVCARRNECRAAGLIETCGRRPGDSKVDIVAWRLSK